MLVVCGISPVSVVSTIVYFVNKRFNSLTTAKFQEEEEWTKKWIKIK